MSTSEFVAVGPNYYQILRTEGDRALLLHMNSTGQGLVNVAKNGYPLLIPGLYWEHLSNCQRSPMPTPTPLPPVPPTPGLQAGSRVIWGTSLGQWAIVAIAGDTATIRQTSGYAQACNFQAKLSELREL